MAKIWKDNGLTIVLMLMFIASLAGQFWTGWNVENEQLSRHGGAAMRLTQFASSPLFLASVFENWESEFLQMAAFVLLTACLVQRGSAESQDPDTPPRDSGLAKKGQQTDAPAMLRWGRTARELYANSLGIALALLFVLSFTSHWIFSTWLAAEEAASHGEAGPTLVEHLASADFWFESFQNWQSEFLSTAVLVVLSIYLRQRESPESKAVAAPHGKTGA